MATIAALIGGNILSGLGQGIIGGMQERRRQQEWDQTFGLKQDQFNYQKQYDNRSLGLTERGQTLNLMGGLAGNAMSAGSGLFGSLLNYQTQSNRLDWDKQLKQQQRTDLEKDGIPLSYLHLGGAGAKLPSLPGTEVQGLGRSTENTFRPMHHGGQPINQTFGARPQSPVNLDATTPAAPGEASHANVPMWNWEKVWS